MPAIPHLFRGETFLLDSAGVLVWPRLYLLAVADLHLEKGTACARQGQLVPPWDSALTLARLAAVIAHYAPATVVTLGDSFHDTDGPSRLSPANHATLCALAANTRIIWVRGNHDPAPPEGLPGESIHAFTAAGITFRHQARHGEAGELSGHFHPKARIPTRAGDVVRPCFMADSQKIVLPAFGAYTGGLDIRSPAIARHFPQGGQAFLLGQARIFCFAVPAPAAEPITPCVANPRKPARPPLVSAPAPHRFG